MDAAVNPLTLPWEAPFELPPFDRLRVEHFKPAFERAMQAHRAELDAIAQQPEPPSFDNTVAALDASGRALGRLEALFYNLAASATSPALQALQREMAAPLAAHWNAVHMDAALFARLDQLHRQRDALGLDDEQRRVLERMHLDFVRAGARLQGADAERYARLMQDLAEATTRFGQNVLHDEATYALPLPDASALAGLPDFVRAAAREAARERRSEAEHAITLSRSLIVPFLTFSERRDLREQAWRAWVARGEHAGEHDNRPLACRILALRREQAGLHGHVCYADYALQDTMAGTQARVWALLDEVWSRALTALETERAMLHDAMRAEGIDPARQPVEPWDWRYWAEKVRRRHFALDEAEVKPYFPLPAMVQALFDCAQRLFGLRFTARPELAAYHPDVQAYEVHRADGRVLGLFLHDGFARPTKRSGAWMSQFRRQRRDARGERVPPVVLNNCNFARGQAGEPALLSLEDVRTLFHEFGHGLHGLMSDVRFERLSGTQVLRDFVELPSQLFEHWMLEPQVLARHARHWRTGEPIPGVLVDRIQAARRFGQAYETVRYTASAIVDLAAHAHANAHAQPIDDVSAFEAQVLAERGLPPGVGMNHRLVHFQHLFAGSGYASQYYVYLWAEVLDADAYEAFREAGDPFDPEVADRLARWIYSRGNSVPPEQAYEAFRGRAARLEPMLRDRGLID